MCWLRDLRQASLSLNFFVWKVGGWGLCISYLLLYNKPPQNVSGLKQYILLRWPWWGLDGCRFVLASVVSWKVGSWLDGLGCPHSYVWCLAASGWDVWALGLSPSSRLAASSWLAGIQGQQDKASSTQFSSISMCCVCSCPIGQGHSHGQGQSQSGEQLAPQGMARRRRIICIFTIYHSGPGRDIGKNKWKMMGFWTVIKIIEISYWHIWAQSMLNEQFSLSRWGNWGSERLITYLEPHS